MNIFTLLKREHREVSEILESLMDSKTEAVKQRPAQLALLRQKLLAHSKAEESTLYARLKKREEMKARISRSESEHYEVEGLLDELKGMEATDTEWDRTILDLKRNIEHHVDEEENQLFDQAKVLLSKEQLETIYDDYQKEEYRWAKQFLSVIIVDRF